MLIRIPSPNAKNIQKKKISTLMEKEYFSSREWMDFVKKQNNPIYKSWKDFHRSTNLPSALSPEEAFLMLTFHRKASAKQTPVQDKEGKNFLWEELSRFRFFCDDFAKNFGVYKAQKPLPKEKREVQRKKIFKGTIEEAIASSQIEGAVITRKQGKELIRSGRKPITDSEKMVLNNYKTILRIEN